MGLPKGQIILKANYAVLNSSKKQTKLTILSIFFIQNSEFLSFLEELRRPQIALETFKTKHNLIE